MFLSLHLYLFSCTSAYLRTIFFIKDGKLLRQTLSVTGKSLSLEMSGSSAMLVFDTADLDSAVEGVIEAGFGYQGQVSLDVIAVLLFQ